MMGLIDDPKVTIYVGVERKGYSLSKKMLCQSSAYFAAVFEGNFQEAITQTLDLEEDDEDAFELLIQYIYTREIVLDEPTNFTKSITRCLGLAKIGDKLGILDVVDIAYDKVFSILKGNSQRLQLCHLHTVFAEDWPPIKESVGNATFADGFAQAVFAIFIGRAVCKEQYNYKDWPLKEALAEVPGMGHLISLITFHRLRRGAESLGTDELYSALGLNRISGHVQR